MCLKRMYDDFVNLYYLSGQQLDPQTMLDNEDDKKSEENNEGRNEGRNEEGNEMEDSIEDENQFADSLEKEGKILLPSRLYVTLYFQLPASSNSAEKEHKSMVVSPSSSVITLSDEGSFATGREDSFENEEQFVGSLESEKEKESMNVSPVTVSEHDLPGII